MEGTLHSTTVAWTPPAKGAAKSDPASPETGDVAGYDSELTNAEEPGFDDVEAVPRPGYAT